MFATIYYIHEIVMTKFEDIALQIRTITVLNHIVQGKYRVNT